MARKPKSKSLIVRRDFEPVREREQPWQMAFEQVLRATRTAENSAKTGNDLIMDVHPHFLAHVQQGG